MGAFDWFNWSGAPTFGFNPEEGKSGAGLSDDAKEARKRLVNEIQRGDMSRGGQAVSPDLKKTQQSTAPDYGPIFPPLDWEADPGIMLPDMPQAPEPPRSFSPTDIYPAPDEGMPPWLQGAIGADPGILLPSGGGGPEMPGISPDTDRLDPRRGMFGTPPKPGTYLEQPGDLPYTEPGLSPDLGGIGGPDAMPGIDLTTPPAPEPPPQTEAAAAAEDPIVSMAMNAGSKGEALAIADEAEASGFFPGARAKLMKKMGWDEEGAENFGQALMGFGAGLLTGGPDFGEAMGHGFAKAADQFVAAKQERRQASLDDLKIRAVDEEMDMRREEMNLKRQQAALERLQGIADVNGKRERFYLDEDGNVRKKDLGPDPDERFGIYGPEFADDFKKLEVIEGLQDEIDGMEDGPEKAQAIERKNALLKLWKMAPEEAI
jgi:hypothetical protein